MNANKLLSQFDHLSLPDRFLHKTGFSPLISMENTAEYDSNAVSDTAMSHSVFGISVRINQDGLAAFSCV